MSNDSHAVWSYSVGGDRKRMLSYTGHAFCDIGVAAITAFARKRHPDELEDEDLAVVAEYIEQNYVLQPLRNYLTMAFTSNAWFAQDAFNPDKSGLSDEERDKRRDKRSERARGHLSLWGTQGEETERCVFFGISVVTAQLSDSLQPGRAARTQIPMQMGEEQINFVPGGNPGLSVSGEALLALQFFPLGCFKVGIGLLAVHSDNEQLLYSFAREALEQTLRNITLCQVSGESKMPRTPRSMKTLLIELLVKFEQERNLASEDQQSASITAYNFNNGKSPDLIIYHLPLEIMRFLQLVQTPRYSEAWKKLVRRNWQQVEKPKKGDQSEQQQASRNFLYEDLFNLPGQAARFMRRYFLQWKTPTEWILIELFLKEVMFMDADRIEQIKRLGDGLAVYVENGGGSKFFRAFRIAKSGWQLRGLLIKANLASIKSNKPALFSVDGYIEVFEEAEETMRADWRLARDLVFMRMVDQLQSWLTRHHEVLEEVEEEEVVEVN